MTFSELQSLIEDVEYKDWRFLATQGESGYFIQLSFTDGQPWKGRKWFISSHATRSEIVQTCLLAVLTAEEHEARERFLFKGLAIFGPHIDVDARAESLSMHLDLRPVA